MLTTGAALNGAPRSAVRARTSRILRRFWSWGQLRRVQEEGFVRAARRHAVWTKVLASPPVETVPLRSAAPYELHLVCHFGDYLPAIWALKSYLRRVEADAHLYLHIQGPCTALMTRRLGRHFPHARIVTQPDADALVMSELRRRGLGRLAALRANSAVMLKLTDVALIGRLPRLLVLDPDVLFFRAPLELHDALLGREPLALFQRDAFTCYVMTPQQARDGFGIDLGERVNTGIAAIDRATIDLDLCDRLLAEPVFAGGWVEQTLYALGASASGYLRWLPPAYALSMQAAPRPDGIVSRHYSGPSRAYMTADGMPWLLHHGLGDAPRRAVE